MKVIGVDFSTGNDRNIICLVRKVKDCNKVEYFGELPDLFSNKLECYERICSVMEESNIPLSRVALGAQAVDIDGFVEYAKLYFTAKGLYSKFIC